MGKKAKTLNTSKGGTMTTAETNETPEVEAPEVDDTDVNETVGQEDNAPDEAPITQALVFASEIVEDNPLKVPEGTVDQDIIELYNLMNEYLKAIALGGANRTEDNVIKFVKIGKFIARRNREKLIDVFYNEIVAGPRNQLMAPDLVFQFINKVNDDNKKNIEVLYTTLMSMRDWFEAPKQKIGFPIDLKKVTEAFGGEALANYVSRKLNL